MRDVDRIAAYMSPISDCVLHVDAEVTLICNKIGSSAILSRAARSNTEKILSFIADQFRSFEMDISKRGIYILCKWQNYRARSS